MANKAQMLDENDKLPRIKQALLADAIATSAGAVLGTSTTTTFVESSSGVAEACENRSCFCSDRFLIPACYFLLTNFLRNPGIRNSSGIDLRRIFNGNNGDLD